MRYNVHVTGTRFIGDDLAWREGSADLVANETGVAVIDADGRVLDAAWKRGVEQTIAWVDSAAADGDAVMFVDAPLVGPQRDRPAALREAGWTKVLALEGQCQYDEHRSPRLAACSSCAWPDCPAGDIPMAAAGRRAQAASSRKPTRTPRWSAPQSWAMTPNVPGTSASRGAFGPLSGGPSALLPATR